MDIQGYIQIKKTPLGEAPEKIREKWVGLKLPCVGKDTNEEAGVNRGVVSDKIRRYRGTAFLVPQKEAIEELRKVSPEAADWWNDHGFPQQGGDCGDFNFSFREEEIEIIDGDIKQRDEGFVVGSLI